LADKGGVLYHYQHFFMNTFIAQVIYRIECEGLPTDQYEEQWRLIHAADQPQALEEARRLSKEGEATFIDRHGRTICWHLMAVKDLQPAELNNGSVLVSMIREAELVAAPIWAE
jgi:hypothetical protein